MKFEFGTAQRIIFGRGQVAGLGELASGMGKRALLVIGQHLLESADLANMESSLTKHGVGVERFLVHGEPETQTVDQAAAHARSCQAELVIGVGGGAVLDLAKATAGMVTNDGSVRDYLEGVGTGRVLNRPALPMVAVPTTAGTGSEVTRNAVISSAREKFKKSIRSQWLLPAVALVDPALSDSVPPAQTAASGLDALTQLIEPYVSTKATPITDALALSGIERVREALGRVFHDGNDTSARDEMALASLLSGLCLANAGLGAVHGIAAALGACCAVPHGLACACVLVQTVEANLRALSMRDPHGEAMRRYAKIGEVLSGSDFASPEDARQAAITALRQMVNTMQIPRLKDIGVRASDLPALVKESRGSSMKSNPIVLEDAQIEAILSSAL